MSVANRIALAITKIRPVVQKVTGLDYCEIIEGIASADNEYGPGLATDAAIEGGSCLLRAGGLQPQERVIADRLGWTVPYVIDLHFTTLATNKHRIRVNGNRTFEIGGVVKLERAGVQATAVVQESG